MHFLRTVLVLVLCGSAAAGKAAPTLRLKQTISLPGVDGRIDHLAVDLAGERLFVCALGNNTAEIIDLRKGERVHSITGLGAPQGVAYVPDSNRLFIANDEGGLCNIYDARRFDLLGKIDFKDDADNVRYDASAKRIYVGFGDGALGIVNANSEKAGSIKLPGHPESFQLEKEGPRIFVNVPTARCVAVIDRNKNEVIASWKLDGASANFPMALDEADHRLFIGCRMPAKLVVLDTNTGQVVSSPEISGDTDDVFYDAGRHRVYAVCGAGSIDVIEQIDSNTYKSVARIPTAAGARTGLYVPEMNSIFIAVPHRGNQTAGIRWYEFQ